MKKSTLYIVGILLISFTLINCGSSKKGCGLTSDAQKIEQHSNFNTAKIVAAK